MPYSTPNLPELVEAVQWLPGRRMASIVCERAAYAGGGALLPAPAHAVLATQWGRLTVFAGDWIITEATGKKHVFADRYFQRRYAALDGQHGVFEQRELPDL